MAPLVGLPIPLLPIHILWINLVTDGLPGLALANEPAEKNTMQRPPRPTNESVFARGLGFQVLWVGILMAAVCLVVQALAMRQEIENWQTMVFTVLCLSQMGNVLAIRSDDQSLFQQGLFGNKPLFGAVLLTLILQLMLIYVPFLNDVFHTKPLNTKELLICVVASSIVFFAVEAAKFFGRMRSAKTSSATAVKSSLSKKDN
jgi:Ca2+-transporting ATPase